LQVNIKTLVDDVQCYQTVRELRWPDGVACPSCQSKQVIKRGFDDTESARQRYECADCHTRFDDLTDTIFAGHHQREQGDAGGSLQTRVEWAVLFACHSNLEKPPDACQTATRYV
jgi:DNA-directed RNA polymerase subunit RPC12/RpoP